MKIKSSTLLPIQSVVSSSEKEEEIIQEESQKRQEIREKEWQQRKIRQKSENTCVCRKEVEGNRTVIKGHLQDNKV